MERRPLVLLSEGITTELPVGDTLPLAGVEPSLGNPASDGQVLSSTAAGVRSWVNVSLKIPFYLSNGTLDTISLNADSSFPFFKSNGSASNIPLVT
jgi:hypothetical protein